MPTLTEHLRLCMILIQIHPDKRFHTLFRFTQQIINNRDLYQLTPTDVITVTSDPSTSDSQYLPMPAASYYYHQQVESTVGTKTLRWFVESYVRPLIETSVLRLQLKISPDSDNRHISLMRLESWLS